VGTGEIVVLVLLETISALCIVAMWRHHRPDRLRKDVVWTVLLLVPIFGPLMWGASYGPLPPRRKP
jgi:hypothetical protein